jgi:membrane protein
MDRIRDFVTDFWGYSAPRIRRADPLLMGAAIAYNSLFALVPLAIAFVAILSFFDSSGRALTELIDQIEEVFPAEVAAFLVEILSQSTDWVQGDQTIVLIVSLLIALWSGSRAVYAVQKALRTVQGIEDERGYFVSRTLGIVVTVAAGAAVLVAYALALLGTRIWTGIEDQFGLATANAGKATMMAIAILWVWLLLWAIYRWGPPEPMPLPSITSASVAALLVLGSVVAFQLAPSGSAVLSVFGAIGVFLIWLYYVGIVVVAAPTGFAGVATALHAQARR